MSLAKFKGDAWDEMHPAYKGSAFTMTPAPEYASSEVLLASLYRTIGLEGVSEAKVPQLGRDLERRLRAAKPGGKPVLSPDAWNSVIHWVLESPKLPNQSAKRFLQMSPVVPEAARYSGSARLAGSPWRPGHLVQRMVMLGSKDANAAARLWERLFQSLQVTPQGDVWARWLEEEFRAWQPPESASFAQRGLGQEDVDAFPLSDRESLPYPARQFARDLEATIAAKGSMTRRQWTSMLEALVRLASVSHVLWLCDVHYRLWRHLQDVLFDGKAPAAVDAMRDVAFPRSPAYLAYGQAALRTVRGHAEGYLHARLGINLVLWSLHELGAGTNTPLSSPAAFAQLAEAASQQRDALLAAGIAGDLAELRDREAGTLSCSKKGIGSNIHDFARHALGQRQTLNNVLKGYDQGYVLRKRGDYGGAPWVVSLGPVLLIALVHCCLHQGGGPRSVHWLCEHLASYGVAVDPKDIGASELGQNLRMLGLVLDSPDAESGMLILPPFPREMSGTQSDAQL
jgi:hypothetical protein